MSIKYKHISKTLADSQNHEYIFLPVRTWSQDERQQKFWGHQYKQPNKSVLFLLMNLKFKYGNNKSLQFIFSKYYTSNGLLDTFPNKVILTQQCKMQLQFVRPMSIAGSRWMLHRIQYKLEGQRVKYHHTNLLMHKNG